MANIILSCGHEVDYLEQGTDLMVKYTDRQGNKAIMYGTFCTECAVEYRQEKSVFDSWTEAEEWLSTPDW